MNQDAINPEPQVYSFAKLRNENGVLILENCPEVVSITREMMEQFVSMINEDRRRKAAE